MGIQDRDYYREHHERLRMEEERERPAKMRSAAEERTPSKPQRQATWLDWFVLVCFCVLLYSVTYYLLERHR
ncbi:Uncharacterised protein [Xylophilus ampelinus]|nr:Uncharacterised protein [Xylophilus ampelinus]